MSDKFQVGNKVLWKELDHQEQSGDVLEILAGPVMEEYWTQDAKGHRRTWHEDWLHPVPRVTFTETQFEVVKKTLERFFPKYGIGRDDTIQTLRRDHSEQPEGGDNEQT